MHGGKCIEGFNRFICDCSSTSFTGPTCGRGKKMDKATNTTPIHSLTEILEKQGYLQSTDLPLVFSEP